MNLKESSQFQGLGEWWLAGHGAGLLNYLTSLI